MVSILICTIIFSVHLQFVLSQAIVNPVIFIPGDGGSRFMVQVNELHDDYFYCATHIDNYQALWVNLEYLVPLTVNCLTERLTLYYQRQSRTTVNKPGVNLTIPGWGQSEEIEYLSEIHIGHLKYFADIVDGLIKSGGYERGKSIRGAPYDFRKGPNELKNFQQRLMKLIENTYSINNNQKVIIVAHSYGCPLTLQMLQEASQDWKDKYIRSFVSLEGPYYGSSVSLMMYLSGYNINIPTIHPSWLRDMQRTWPSSYFLLPDERQWDNHEILVKAPHRNYTSRDYRQLFDDTKYPLGWDHYTDIRQLINPEIPPGVEAFCIVGRGMQTLAWLDCRKSKGWPLSVGGCKNVYGDGDGTVPWRSLNACSRWKGRQSQPTHFKVIPNVDHFSILKDPRLVDYIINEVLDYGTPV